MSAPEHDASTGNTGPQDRPPADAAGAAPTAKRSATAPAPAPATRAATRNTVAAAATAEPRWRDMVLPVLYPQAQGPASWRLRALRATYWLMLQAIFAAGVVLPFAGPELIRAFQRKVTGAPLLSAATTAADSPYPAGTRLRDCGDDTVCPWLRVVPPGSFRMGSAASEQDRGDDEGPQHPVTFTKKLAVMETEVTRGQFDAFIKDSRYEVKPGCHSWDSKEFKLDPNRSWSSPGFEQTDQHPVVCVSWADATAYAMWLSKITRQTYLLLSEAEWEYAARAGSTTRYSFGDRSEELCTHANVGDRGAKAQRKDFTIAECSDGYVFTAPVRSYKANAFGLFDMHGNAWEWTTDCWHGGYKNAPLDGSSWQNSCTEQGRRVLRGGGWFDLPVDARSAIRLGFVLDDRYGDIGFRLARTLTLSILTPLQPTQQSAK